MLGFHFSIKKVIMKRITKQIKRLRDFSLWGNRWAKNTINDRERNLKKYVNQTGCFVCLLSCNSSLKVSDTGVSSVLGVKVLVELFGVICSKSSS